MARFRRYHRSMLNSCCGVHPEWKSKINTQDAHFNIRFNIDRGHAQTCRDLPHPRRPSSWWQSSAGSQLVLHALSCTLALNSPGSEGMPSKSAASVILMPRSASAANAVAAATALSLAPAPDESCRCQSLVSRPWVLGSVGSVTTSKLRRQGQTQQ